MDPGTAALAGQGIAGLAGLAGAGIAGSASAAATSQAVQAQREMFDANWNKQFEMAHDGLTWRVNDAIRAGIHPLFALGAQVSSGSPVMAGMAIPETGHMGAAVADMGQNIGRAISAMADKDSKLEALQNLQIERGGLENELLRSQIAQVRAGTGPGLPSTSGLPGTLTKSGQGDAYVAEVPLQRTHSSPYGGAHLEVGHVADVGFAKTPTGLAPIPSKDVKERIEDQVIPETAWAIRNQLAPNWGGGTAPGPELLPKGASHWEWSRWGQEWRAVYPDERREVMPRFKLW